MVAPLQSIPPTVSAVSSTSAQTFADAPAQRFARDGQWVDLSYRELHERVEAIAAGLIDLGIEPGERVCILADTRPEWVQLQFAIAAAGCVVVPVYPSNSPPECEWVVRDSESVVIFCADEAQAAKIDQVRGTLPLLRHLITIDPAPGRDSLEELKARANEQTRAEVARRTEAQRPEDPTLIIYTSGTTGKPKGCVLTHENFMSSCRATVEMDTSRANDITYLFLPLAHVFAQLVNLASMTVGAVVAFASAGASAIMSDLQALHPTSFPSVPRIYEKVYTAVCGSIPAEKLASWTTAHATAAEDTAAGRPVSPEVTALLEEAAPVFGAARQAFGGNLRVAITGAAPIAPEILTFFEAAGVPILEGFGMSESTSTGLLNPIGSTRVGTVGKTIPRCEVRIAEDGEILMRGPHIFAGYWHNEAATQEAVRDGWLHTGDLGSLDDDGYVRITGRKKDIIITAGGKNLTPSEMENGLRQSPFVSHAVMHGDRRPYPVALITIDVEYAVPWAEKSGLPTDLPSLTKSAELLEVIQKLVDEVNSHHASVAQIKRFAVLDHDFSQETGELTPTLKLKRQVVNTKYMELLDSIYAQA